MTKSVVDTLSSVLTRAKFVLHQTRALTAAIDFVNAGGTRDEWMKVYDMVAGKNTAGIVNTPLKPSKASPLQPISNDAMRRVQERSAKSIFDRCLTHSGKMWGNVKYHELTSLRDDGDLAIAVKQHIGVLTGEHRYKKIRDLMTVTAFAQIFKRTKNKSNRALS